MLIDFASIDESVIPNFKGGDGDFHTRIFERDGNKVMSAPRPAGPANGLHTPSGHCEVIIGLSGRGTAICDGVSEEVSAGMCHYCPEGSTHTLRNEGPEDLAFYAVVPRQ